MIVDSDRDRADLAQWFESIWNENLEIIQDVKEEVLLYLSQLYAENSPEFIYYKTLFHVFDKFLDSQGDRDFEINKNLFDSQIWNGLYDFLHICDGTLAENKKIKMQLSNFKMSGMDSQIIRGERIVMKGAIVQGVDRLTIDAKTKVEVYF